MTTKVQTTKRSSKPTAAALHHVGDTWRMYRETIIADVGEAAAIADRCQGLADCLDGNAALADHRAALVSVAKGLTAMAAADEVLTGAA